MGIPLYNIKDVRTMYGMDPFGNEPIDFDKYVKFYQSILVTLLSRLAFATEKVMHPIHNYDVSPMCHFY